MASQKDLKKAAKLNFIVKELELLMGWRTASLYARDKDELPCGVLIGDVTFFELIEESGDDDA